MLSWQQAKLLRDPSHGWLKKNLLRSLHPKSRGEKITNSYKFHWLIWHDRIIYDLHNNHQTLSVNLSDTLLINHTNRKQDVCLWLKKKNAIWILINWGIFQWQVWFPKMKHMKQFITSNIWIPITIEPTEHTVKSRQLNWTNQAGQEMCGSYILMTHNIIPYPSIFQNSTISIYIFITLPLWWV